MKPKVLLNYLYNVSYQILNLLTPIITAPYLTRVLGATNLGIYNYTYYIVYFFTLFGIMGIGLYGSKEVAKVANDKKKLSEVFSELFTLQLITSIISFTVFYIVFTIFNFQYKTVFLLQGILLVGTMFDITWLYNGLENFKKVTTRAFIVKLLLVAGIFVIVKSEQDLKIYTLFTSIMSIISSVIIWFNINKVVSYKIPKLSRLKIRFKENFILFIPQISTSIYAVLDQVMIEWFYTNVDEVAFYGQAHKLVNMLLFLVTTMGTVMLPNIVKRRKDGDKSKVREVTNLTFKIALFLSIPIAIGFSTVAPFFITWFLPPEFNKVAYVICSLAPIIVFISLSNVLGVQYLVALDESKKFTISVTVGCFINIILNACLIGYLGAYGAAIASCVTELSVLLIQYFYVRKSFCFTGVIRKFFRYILTGAVMGIVVYTIGYYMGSGIKTNLVQFIAGSIVYLGILLILGDDIERFLIDKGLDLFRRKKIKE